MPQIHRLKTLPAYFNAVRSGNKTFELRQNDRDFRVGDVLVLQEFIPDAEAETGVLPGLTGQEEVRRASYVLHGGVYGLAKGWVILGLSARAEDG